MRKLIKLLKFRFYRLNGREKSFLFIFLFILSVVWLSSCLNQTKVLMHDWKFLNAKVKNCRFWIKNKAIVEANLKRVFEVMDPAKTLSGAAFAGEVESIIRAYNLRYFMSSPRTRNGDIFDTHTLQLHCENASLASLIQFEAGLYQKKPYLGLEKVKLHANLFNPELLEADFSLCSLQLKDILNGN